MRAVLALKAVRAPHSPLFALEQGLLVARCRGRTPCPGLAGPPKKDAARDGRENPGVGPKKPRVRPAASFISSSAHALFRKHLLQRSPEPSNCSHPSPAESFPFATNLGANKRTLPSGTGIRGLNSTFFLRIPRCGQRGRAPEGSAPAGQGPGQELHSSVPPSAPCTRPQDGSFRFAWARPPQLPAKEDSFVLSGAIHPAMPVCCKNIITAQSKNILTAK